MGYKPSSKHAYIGKPMSHIASQHLPYPIYITLPTSNVATTIICSMYTLVCWHRMWTAGIVLSLHISMHRFGPMTSNQPSAACIKRDMCSFRKRSNPMEWKFSQVLHAQKWHVHIWEETSPNRMHHHQKCAHIIHVKCIFIGQLHPWSMCIG